jgi:hypothetical protein
MSAPKHLTLSDINYPLRAESVPVLALERSIVIAGFKSRAVKKMTDVFAGK